MKQRCNNPNDPAYEWYGAKGIKVCDEWHDFVPFMEWALENGYEEGLTIDREDSDGDYEPSNCRWITRGSNTGRAAKVRKIHNGGRSPLMIEFDGRNKSIDDWAEELGIKKITLYQRLKKGWSEERALTTPVRKKSQ